MSATLSQHTLQVLLDNMDFATVLDIGSGKGWHSEQFRNAGKTVTAIDFGTSAYFAEGDGSHTIRGDYMAIELPEPFDCVWISHVLEHQLDVHQFLKKVHRDLEEDGWLAITVPPLKHEIVGGHVSLWNAGLLLYRLILAGFDCSAARCRAYGYNVSVIVQKRTIRELPSLDYDIGDIERLAAYFPFDAKQGFDGNIQELNWPWQVQPGQS